MHAISFIYKINPALARNRLTRKFRPMNASRAYIMRAISKLILNVSGVGEFSATITVIPAKAGIQKR